MNKVIIRILLSVAACALAYFCIMSVLTPIQFEEERKVREVAVVKNLVALRTAELEFQRVNNRFTPNLDSLVLFLKNTPKKEVRKEGALTDKHLEAGMTEHKAVKILEDAKKKALRRQQFTDEDALYAYIWENDREVKSNNLHGFRRDTVYKNMIETLYKGEYTAENIDKIITIPYTDGQNFEIEVNNSYTTSQGIRIPLFEARAHHNTYLEDLNKQELVNLIDKETKLDHYPGLKVGDITQPNNNAGNWE